MRLIESEPETRGGVVRRGHPSALDEVGIDHTVQDASLAHRPSS